VAFERLGMTPVSLTLGDVLPALQEGTIDASITGISPIVKFHMIDAAKYVTAINQPAIFIIAVVNKKWYESLPKHLQHIVDSDAAKEDAAINPLAVKNRDDAQKAWTASGGTLIKLSPIERAKMMKILASVGTDVASKNPKLAAAYKTVTGAARRLEAAGN
jgi:TRAP-type C4-dicarboxylate transport system substrate-binding protein